MKSIKIGFSLLLAGLFVITLPGNAAVAPKVEILAGQTYMTISDGEGGKEEKILTAVYMTTDKGEKVVAFTPAGYNKKGSIVRLLKVLFKSSNKSGNIGWYMTIHGILLTKDSYKTSSITDSEFEMYMDSGYKVYLLKKIIVGNTEIDYK